MSTTRFVHKMIPSADDVNYRIMVDLQFRSVRMIDILGTRCGRLNVISRTINRGNVLANTLYVSNLETLGTRFWWEFVGRRVTRPKPEVAGCFQDDCRGRL